MDTSSNTGKTASNASELDKFKLFYEFATPTRDVHRKLRRSRDMSRG